MPRDDAFQHYVQAFNKFTDPTGGLSAGLRHYLGEEDAGTAGSAAAAAARRAARSASADERVRPIDIVSFNYVSLGIDALKKGVDLAVSPGRPVDDSARALLGKVQVLHAKAKAMNDYYASSKYLDDQWARDRTERPALVAAWKEAVQAQSEFGREISAMNDQRRVQDIEALRARGQWLEADTLLAIGRSKELVQLLRERPEDFGPSDAKAAELEAVLADHDKAEEKARAAGRLDNDFQTQFRGHLTRLVGHYRRLKAGPASARDAAFQAMVDAYNEAIFYKNRM